MSVTTWERVLPGWSSENPSGGFRGFLSRILLLYSGGFSWRMQASHRDFKIRPSRFRSVASFKTLARSSHRSSLASLPPLSVSESVKVTVKWRWVMSPCHPVALLPSAYCVFPSCYIRAQLASPPATHATSDVSIIKTNRSVCVFFSPGECIGTS